MIYHNETVNYVHPIPHYNFFTRTQVLSISYLNLRGFPLYMTSNKGTTRQTNVHVFMLDKEQTKKFQKGYVVPHERSMFCKLIFVPLLVWNKFTHTKQDKQFLLIQWAGLCDGFSKAIVLNKYQTIFLKSESSLSL